MQPILLYELECLAMRKQGEKRILPAEMSWLRKMPEFSSRPKGQQKLEMVRYATITRYPNAGELLETQFHALCSREIISNAVWVYVSVLLSVTVCLEFPYCQRPQSACLFYQDECGMTKSTICGMTARAADGRRPIACVTQPSRSLPLPC